MRKRQWKKILSMVLALAMVFSMNTSVFAAEVTAPAVEAEASDGTPEAKTGEEKPGAEIPEEKPGAETPEEKPEAKAPTQFQITPSSAAPKSWQRNS